MSYIGSTPTSQNFISGTDYFNGTGAQVAFTLSRLVNSVNDIEVIVNNVEQIPSGYTVLGTTLTFSAAPSAGTSNVYVRYLSTTLQSIAVPAGSTQPINITGNAATVTTNANLTGDVTSVGNATTLSTSGVTAGSYTYSSITVDAKGRLTTASSGSAPVAFPTGTLMLFVQTAAPTGWTKSTAHNDKSLRVVSGTASSGGSSAFTTVFTNQTPTITTSGLSAGATTLSTAQMPSHSHSYRAFSGYNGTYGVQFQSQDGGFQASTATGGGGSHTHTVSGSATSSAITLAVQYVDVIIATKD